MAFKLPTELKLTQLKHIAYKCGISSSGTKSVLADRLTRETASSAQHDATRVLSIDMGIRNMAYCVLDMPSRSRGRVSSRTSRAEQGAAALPRLLDWRRIAVSPAPLKEDKASKESFEPSVMAAIACKLVRERLLSSAPDKVLIERQRFRSMGSSHVLEWTVRVNMLEAMLYAVFQTLKDEGRWSGQVIAIAPGKVGPYWIDEDAAVATNEDVTPTTHKKTRTSHSAKLRNKGRKMDLVRSWLHNHSMVELASEAVQATAVAYTEKWDRRPGGRKGKRVVDQDGASSEEEIGKLDDLADCLLQAMAWRDWEENKLIVRSCGVEALMND